MYRGSSKDTKEAGESSNGMQAMADQGSGGAYEISQRMTAMLGWGATTQFQEDWTWDQAAETYVSDEAMANKLHKNNPEVSLLLLCMLHHQAGFRCMFAL